MRSVIIILLLSAITVRSEVSVSVGTAPVSPWYTEPEIIVTPPAPVTFDGGIISGGRIVAQGVDIEATTPDTGYILTDASTNKWLVTIADGEVIGVQISASPEIGMDERRARLAAKRAEVKAKRDKAKAELNGQLQQRIANLERLMGLRD
jgi:hypothetical protein